MRRKTLWLVDLDNTLHDASWQVMGEINRRMTRYVQEALSLPPDEASSVRQLYWRRYGATLLGLVRHHNVDPHHFLRETHPIEDLEHMLLPEAGLARRIRLLRGRRWLITNSPRHYATRVMRHLGIHREFERVICIEDMRAMGRLKPKPSPWLWHHLHRQSGQPRHHLTLVDDSSENLRGAHRAGLRTARLWASTTVRQSGWKRGRPPTAVRPHFVRHQVHSLAVLARLP